MPKVTNVKTTADQGAGTPSQQMATVADHVVTDDAGRLIKLRKPGILAQFRLVEALGDAASNDVYMAMVLPLIYVAQLEDDLLPPLRTKGEVEALIQRLDDHGMRAVSAGIREHFSQASKGGDAQAVKK